MKLAESTNKTSLVWRLLLQLLFLLIHGTDLLAQTCVQPPLGIIVWWPMDETSGTTVTDITGNHPGIQVNAPTFASGKVGGALRFNGSNSYVGVGDSDDWAFATADFTIELWANFSSPGGGTVGHPSHIFIGNDDGPGNQNKWFFALGGGFLNFHIKVRHLVRNSSRLLHFLQRLILGNT